MRRNNTVRQIAISSLLFSAPLCADWNYEPLLKGAPEKQMKGSIKGIDFMYVINLDRRPEKFAGVKEQFAQFGVEPYRFSAVNGWEISPEVMRGLGLTVSKKTKKGLMGTYYDFDTEKGLHEKHIPLSFSNRPCLSHCMSRGAVGIVLSHLSVIKDAYDSGYQRVWIMEDDVDVRGDINRLKILIREANRSAKNWDILYTDIDTITNSGAQKPTFGMAFRPDLRARHAKRLALVKRTPLGNHFTLLGTRFGAYSYLINRSGMKKILRFFKEHHLFLPYDMELIYIDGLKQIALRENLVTTKINSPSDNGGPNYLQNPAP